MATIPLTPPVRGLNKGLPYSGMPSEFSVDELNTMTTDVAERRVRVAQRSGTSKHFSDSVVSSGVLAVQDINHLSSGAAPAPSTTANVEWSFDTGAAARAVVVDADNTFAYVAGNRFNSKSVWKVNADTGVEAASYDTESNTYAVFVSADGGVLACGVSDASGRNVWKLDTDLNLTWGVTAKSAASAPTDIVTDGNNGVYVLVADEVHKFDKDGNALWSTALGSGQQGMDISNAQDKLFVCEAGGGTGTVSRLNTSDGSLDFTASIGQAAWSVRVGAGDDNVYIVGNTADARTVSKWSNDTLSLTLVWSVDLSSDGVAIDIDSSDNLYVSADLSGDHGMHKLSGSGVSQWGAIDSDLIPSDTSLSGRMLTLDPKLERYIYLAGQNAGGTVSVKKYDGFEVTTVQIKFRSITQMYVADGDIKVYDGATLSAATGGTNAVSASQNAVYSAEINNVFYLVDGTNYVKLDASTSTASTWTASNGGTLPSISSNTARLIERWQSRIVVFGVVGDDHNIYMSKVDDPLDFDVSPSPTTIGDATVFDTGNAGIVGALVTGFVPYSDDTAIIGTDQSINVLRGNPSPLGGGRLDTISEGVGMAWGRAWAIDPTGVLYFVGQHGVYAMKVSVDAVSGPELVGPLQIESELRDVNLGGVSIKLAWDTYLDGLFVFVTKNAPESVSTHYFWQRQTGAWRPLQMPSLHGPTAVHVLDGDGPDDRVVLMGGRDSKVRKFDYSSNTDDGDTISSFCRFAPMQPGGGSNRFGVRAVRPVFSSQTTGVTHKLYTGKTPELAAIKVNADSEKAYTSGNRQAGSRDRVAGNAFCFELSNNVNDTTWALESVEIDGDVLGPVRA